MASELLLVAAVSIGGSSLVVAGYLTLVARGYRSRHRELVNGFDRFCAAIEADELEWQHR